MPSNKFYPGDQMVVSTPKFNYTVNDLYKFLHDIDCPICQSLLNDTQQLIYAFNPPNVELHALHGFGVKTEASFLYKKQKDFPNRLPVSFYGDGDGTVNIKSLNAYKVWIGKQEQPIFQQEYANVTHGGILFHKPSRQSNFQKVVLKSCKAYKKTP